MTYEKKPCDTKELRKKYGVMGLSIIQIVGIIFVIAIVATIVHNIFS
ncbi:MAG: hypothetical protein ACHQAX_07385 [Gammaproteobacteria bacterium]